MEYHGRPRLERPGGSYTPTHMWMCLQENGQIDRCDGISKVSWLTLNVIFKFFFNIILKLLFDQNLIMINYKCNNNFKAKSILKEYKKEIPKLPFTPFEFFLIKLVIYKHQTEIK